MQNTESTTFNSENLFQDNCRQGYDMLNTPDNIGDLLRKLQLPLFNDFSVLDDVDRYIMVNEADDIQIQGIDGAFNLYDILLAHLVAAGVFDDRHRTVQLVQPQIVIDGHGFSGFDVIHDIAFLQCSDV